MQSNKPYYFRIQQSPSIDTGIEIVVGAETSLIIGGAVGLSALIAFGAKTIEWGKAALVFFRTTMPNTAKATELDEFIEAALNTVLKYMPEMSTENSELLKTRLKAQGTTKVAEFTGKMMVSTPEVVVETLNKIIGQ